MQVHLLTQTEAQTHTTEQTSRPGSCLEDMTHHHLRIQAAQGGLHST